MALIQDLIKALTQLTDRQLLGPVLKALGLTIALLGLLMVVVLPVAWSVDAIVGLLPGDPTAWLARHLPWLFGEGTLTGWVWSASSVLMIPVAALFLSMFLSDIAAAVEARHYPGAGAARKQGLGEVVRSALMFFGKLILVNLLALIPYLVLLAVFPLAATALIWLVNGYFLGREYFETVAQRHLHARDAHALRRRNNGRVWAMGTGMVILLTIPIMNLLVPVLGVATVTHQFHRLRGA